LELVIDTLSKDIRYVEFPVGINRTYLDNVCYELDRETDTLTICSEGNFYSSLKKRAPDLINRFGLRKINILKKLSLFLSVVLFIPLILKIVSGDPASLLPLVSISGSLMFFVLASYLSEIENYCNIFRCKNCGRDFAYEEIKRPFVKIVSTYNKYEKTITSYLKCRYCNDEYIRTEIARQNSKSRSKKTDKNRKTCKGCGKDYSLVEYRYPDAHLEYHNIFRTIRHYKCVHCGYVEVRIKDDHITINRV
jgi:hypothetical protein